MARTSKVMTEAYCVDLGCVVDIYKAREEFFSQDEPRKEYSFLCSDEECRNECSPRVTGVNYRSEEYKVLPHFRENENHGHSETCYWVDIGDALEEVKRIRRGNRDICLNIEQEFSNLEPSQVYDEYVLEADLIDSEPPTTVDGRLIREIQNRPHRIREYAKHLLRTKKRTSILERIVACYTLMSTEEKKRAKIMIGKHQFDSYSRAFKPNRWLKRFFSYPYIYSGRATIEKDEKGYSIKYTDTVDKYDANCKTEAVAGCFLPNHILDTYIYKKHLTSTLDIVSESKGRLCNFHIISDEHILFAQGSNHYRSNLLNTDESDLVEMFPASLRDIVVIPV